MKIGILTQPINNNYGGILQNYALQTVLTRMGHEVETLNWDAYILNNHIDTTIIQRILQVIKTFISRYLFKRTRNYYWEQKDFFYQLSTNNKPFINKHLRVSEWLFGKKQFRNYVIKEHFETLIVGSDQVWRPEYNKSGMLYRMFLDFAFDLDIKRIAYAASYGVDFWEYDDEQTDKCSKLLQAFNAVSVRELSGATLCQQHLSIPHVECVLDPTLLLTADDYESLLLGYDKKKASNNRLLTTYILNLSEDKKKLISNIAKQEKLNIAEFIPQYCNLNTVTKSTINDYLSPSVIEWLQAFHDAEYIICDSFHGTVFSIIFNKPFIAIGNRKRGYGRFLSLLKQFNLENNLIDETISIDCAIKILNSPIDWNQVNKKRQELKQLSIRFLNNALKL